MSGRAYRVVSRSSLEHNRRAHQTLLLRLSLLVNIIAFVLLFWSRFHTQPDQADSQWKQLLAQSASSVSSLNKDLQATALTLQSAKDSLGVAHIQKPAQRAEMQAPGRGTHLDIHTDSASQDSDQPLWLTIGIPTVPRHNHTDYLTLTLRYLMAELPSDPADPIFGKVKVLVMNNLPGQHPVFDKVLQDVQLGASDKRNTFARKAKQYVEFVDNQGTVEDPTPDDRPEPDDLNNPLDIPGREVRQQTCDLIELMELAQPLSAYYMFMEDDFRMCPHTIRLLHYILAKANALPRSLPWLGLRVSYGMNGIVLKAADLASLAMYMRMRIDVKPPDLLWLEWLSGKGAHMLANKKRPLAVYKYNLLEHMGKVSSFTVRVDRPEFPKCYESMADVWSLSKAERFQARRCPNSDLSPCPAVGSTDGWMHVPLAQLQPLQTDVAI